MITQLLHAQSPADIARAAALLQAGALVAMPTETVYGLAANALNPAAVAQIFTAKGRPQDNPLIVHVPSPAAANDLIASNEVQTKQLRALAKAFWPGPLTVILPKTERVPNIVSAGLDTVAVRVPAHPTALALLNACGLPLAAPSANVSGSPSPTTAAHVLHDFDGKIAAIVDGGACEVGVESTVITLAAETPTLLRPGGIAPAQLEEILGKIKISQAVTQALQAGEQAASPGMKYKHYAPRAQLTLVRSSLPQFIQYAHEQAPDGVLCFDEDLPIVHCSLSIIHCLSYGASENPGAQARQIFARLREIDELGLRRVLVRCPKEEGVGLAVYNRLLRAAGFSVAAL